MHADKPSSTLQTSIIHGKSSIAKGSLSFNLAAKFLPQAKRDGIRMLYAWCRFADDVVDQSSSVSAEEQQRVLQRLEKKTLAALRGEPTTDPVFVGLAHVSKQYGIPHLYFQEVLRGFTSDLQHKPVADEQELRLYCYRVAGVIGLMFCHIVGVNSEHALSRAVDLGTAMQMTNIARDVMEDYRMGRVYLPKSWLEVFALTPETLADPRNLSQVANVVKRLLVTAEEMYRSGNEGLDHLPFRTAIAVATASRVYRAIGHKVLEKGPRAWRRRTWISLPQKLACAFGGCLQVLKSVPRRLQRPFQPVVISQVYQRYSTHES